MSTLYVRWTNRSRQLSLRHIVAEVNQPENRTSEKLDRAVGRVQASLTLARGPLETTHTGILTVLGYQVPGTYRTIKVSETESCVPT